MGLEILCACFCDVWPDRTLSNIRHSSFSSYQVDSKLFLALSVSQPVELHVCGFGSLWFDFEVDDGICHEIVSLKRCWRLCVAQFFKYDADVHRLTGHDI